MSDGTKIELIQRPGTKGATMNALVKICCGCLHAAHSGPCFADEQCLCEQYPELRTGSPHIVYVDGVKLLAPLKAKKPRTYFVEDLFYEGVSDEVIDRHFAVFALCPQHTFIVQTKRPERMLAYLNAAEGANGRVGCAEAICEVLMGDHGFTEKQAWDLPWPLPNVWLGVSVEDQATVDARIPLLLQTPAAVRFISYEPALGPVDFGVLLGTQRWIHRNSEPFKSFPDDYEKAIDWVICGGESGRGARPMHPDWARSVRDQCVAAGVPFFFKQWGEWIDDTGIAMDHKFHVKAFDHGDWLSVPDDHVSEDDFGCLMYRVGKKAAGNLARRQGVAAVPSLELQGGLR
jgi:protein gp37